MHTLIKGVIIGSASMRPALVIKYRFIVRSYRFPL